MNCAPIETLRRIVRNAARRMQRWPDLVSDGLGDRFLIFWLWYCPLAWVRRCPISMVVVLLVALLLSGCATWCRVASGSVVIAEGLVQTWTAIARDACVPERTGRCDEAQAHLERALAALSMAQLAAAACGPEEEVAGFALARIDQDVDLDALENELAALEKAAEEWRK